MRFRIDLGEGGKGQENAWRALGVRVMELMGTTPALVVLASVLIVGVAYFALLAPLLGGHVGQRERLRELRLVQASLVQEKESTLQEVRAALALESESPGWAGLLATVGALVPDGVWLSRIAMEESKESRARRPIQGPQAQGTSANVFLVIEGFVDARRFSSVLEPLSRMVAQLQAEPGIGRILSNLELSSTQATKEDSRVVGFQIRGRWDPAELGPKPEDRMNKALQEVSPKGIGR